MKTRLATIIVTVTAIVSSAFVSSVQAAPTLQGSPPSGGFAGGFHRPLSSADMEKIDNVSEADRQKFKAQAKQESTKLISAMQLACELVDAELEGRGKSKVNGKTLDVTAYEVACSNHLGYILVSQGEQKPIAMSCFAAATTYEADIANGDKPNFRCRLEANKDVKVIAAALMTTVGAACNVSNVKSFGMNDTTHVEYTEVACTDGNGYLLKIPQTISDIQVSAMTCQDAAKQGLQCHLTDGGPVSKPVTTQALRDALKQNGVNCEFSQLRVIGRETIDRRYVVEVQGPNQPKGMIAFIPLEGNTSKFETIDCATAIERQIVCKLTAQQ